MELNGSTIDPTWPTTPTWTGACPSRSPPGRGEQARIRGTRWLRRRDRFRCDHGDDDRYLRSARGLLDRSHGGSDDRRHRGPDRGPELSAGNPGSFRGMAAPSVTFVSATVVRRCTPPGDGKVLVEVEIRREERGGGRALHVRRGRSPVPAGDANADGMFNVADAVKILSYLFASAP